MLQFIFFLSLVNFFGLIYLIFIVYQKNKKISPNYPPSGLKTTLTRFNPFSEIGGDQSFILCLLDNADSGVIITSLHNRDYTRVYAKSIHQGKAVGPALSTEEMATLLKTVNIHHESK